MHVFISAGEPSGDLHGSNLARALQARAPVRLTGLGGPRMRSAGVALHFPFAEHAIMGFVAVLRVVPAMADLRDRVTAAWERDRPDVVVLIDYPGFHWWLAARAQAMGLPVVSFVPPQIWAWASHRVRKMRRSFNEVLCALPFEEAWFRERGVSARYVGHPYFDELARRRTDAAFLASQRGRPIVGLLPGSRGNEVRHNLATLLGTARYIHAKRPDVRFLFACFREQHAEWIGRRLAAERLPADTHVGRTAEIIELSEACVAVSGSVGLELLYHSKPSVVIYRTTPFYRVLAGLLQNVPHISIVNLLAGRELFPEFLLDRDDGERPGRHVVDWLNEPAAREAVAGPLAELRGRVARPGACEAAAEHLLRRYGVNAARAA